jgi:hypothetical protein
MSLYEILVVVALAAAGGYAWYLYRSDVRSSRTGEAKAEGEPMFRRAPRDGKASDDLRK